MSDTFGITSSAMKLLSLAILGLALLRWLTPPLLLHPDTGWFLYAADAWQRGLLPYRDLVEVNPPLVLYLHWLPVWLARSLELSPQLCFRVLMAGFWLACYCWALRWRPQRLGGPVQAVLLLFALLFFAGLDYGQREHLLICAAAPWLMLCCRRELGEAAPGRFQLAALGCLAGLGFALKPQFLGIPLLVLGLQLWRSGQAVVLRRPEWWGLGGLLLAYLCHLPLLGWSQDFFASLALVWSSYGAYRGESIGYWLLPALLLALLALDQLLPRGGAAADAPAPLRPLLALVAAGALAGYLLQGKGWSYHLLPFMAVVAGILGSRRLAGVAGQRFAPLLLCGFGLVFGYDLAAHLFDRGPQGQLRWAAPPTQIGPEFDAVKELEPGAGVLVLDTGIPSFFAYISERRLHWSSRYACLWPLPAALGDQAAEARLRQQILADLDQHPPALLYLRKGRLRHMDAADFDLLAWLGGPELLRARGYRAVRGPLLHHLFVR